MWIYLLVAYLVTGAIISIAHVADKKYSTTQKVVGFCVITPLWVPLIIARYVLP